MNEPVLDASVVADALIRRGPAGRAAREALGAVRHLQVPAILEAEVLSALRRAEREGLAAGALRAARRRLAALPVRPHPFAPFARRVWALRHTLTVYDAWYVAVAEARDTQLVTADARLAAASGPRCAIHVLTP